MILKGEAKKKDDNITDPAKRSWPVGDLDINTNYTVKVFARNYVFEGNVIKKTFQTKFEGEKTLVGKVLIFAKKNCHKLFFNHLLIY